MDTRYNLNDRYTEKMNDKILQYNNLVRKAEITHRDNNGAVSKEEGQLYIEASKIAAEIANMNLSQPAVKAQWLYRKNDCEEKVKNIVLTIAPPPAEPAPKAENTNANAGAAAPVTDKNGVTKTASGFTTKNASKDVPADVIESWHKKAPNHTLEDIAGLDNLKEELKGIMATIELQKSMAELGLNSTKSYFFYGAPGTGKTYIIEAFAGEMMKKGYNFIHLVGGDIHASLVGVAEKTVATAFKEAIDNAPCVLFFDEFEELCKSRSAKAEGHEKRLTNAFLEAYNELVSSNASVIMLAAANYPSQIDEAMMSRFSKKIKFPIPDEESRRNYWTRNIKKMNLDVSITIDKLVDLTQGYSIRDMGNIIQGVKDYLLLEAYKKYRVVNEEGNDDIQKTDENISQALSSNEFLIDPENFYKIVEANPKTPNQKILDDIAAFEANNK